MASEAELVARATAQGLTLAVAESLTAGLVCARIADVPGASRVLRGGAVTYATYTKASLLGVSEHLLASHGPVHPEVAEQMAAGVRSRFGAAIGLATTGVAGPGPTEGHAAGTVFIAVVAASGSWVEELHLAGDRAGIRAKTVDRIMDLTLRTMRGTQGPVTTLG